jgi:hypothetical protein
MEAVMENRIYIVNSDAGDGLNGRAFDDLDTAKAAVEAAFTDGEWYEEDMPGCEQNYWIYRRDDETVAEVLPQ